MKHTKGLVATYGQCVVSVEKANVIVADCLIDSHDADRIAACWNALEGIADPEAFMRDVRLYGKNKYEMTCGGNVTFYDIRQHLKGGAE